MARPLNDRERYIRSALNFMLTEENGTVAFQRFAAAHPELGSEQAGEFFADAMLSRVEAYEAELGEAVDVAAGQEPISWVADSPGIARVDVGWIDSAGNAQVRTAYAEVETGDTAGDIEAKARETLASWHRGTSDIPGTAEIRIVDIIKKAAPSQRRGRQGNAIEDFGSQDAESVND